MATRAISFGARVVPKPTFTGGVPESRNADRSSGSGRSFRQVPRAGLYDVEVCRLMPQAEDRVRRQPRVVGVEVQNVGGLCRPLLPDVTRLMRAQG
jgi:hypothetical protein